MISSIVQGLVDLSSNLVKNVLPVSKGGTGSNSINDILTNLSIYSKAEINALLSNIEIKRIQPAYQDFTAGDINSTSVTLTANHNGTNAPFNSSEILNGKIAICQKNNIGAYVYTGTTSFFSPKVKVDSFSGADITLSGIPNVSWGDVRIYYTLYTSSAPASDFSNSEDVIPASMLDKLDPIIITVDELVANLTSTDDGKALSASQGKILKDLIDAIGNIDIQDAYDNSSDGKIVADAIRGALKSQGFSSQNIHEFLDNSGVLKFFINASGNPDGQTFIFNDRSAQSDYGAFSSGKRALYDRYGLKIATDVSTTKKSLLENIKVKFDHSDFQTASTTNTYTAYTLPARTVLKRLILEIETAVAGSGFSSYKVRIGKTGDDDYYTEFNGGGADFELYGESAGVIDVTDILNSRQFDAFASTHDIVITITSVGANLDQSSAGEFNLHMETINLAS